MATMIKEIDVKTAHSKMDSNENATVFLDVRTPEEYKEVRVDGYLNFPLDQIGQKELPFSLDSDIVIMCRGGFRSMTACEKLQRMGASELSNVAGGIVAWMDEKLPVDKG
jgi:rhodanese-related sulfurtransferase